MLALALLVPLVATPLLDDQARVFEQELARVQRKMEQGNWRSARIQLQRALEGHADQGYVLGQLGEIELALQRCVFWEERADIDVASHFKGELLSYSKANGKLKLRYEEGKPHDFEQKGLARVHPIEFSGPYSIEIEKESGASMVVCAQGGNQIQVNFGRVFNLGANNPNHKKPTQRWCQVNSILIDDKGERVHGEERKDFTSKRKLKSITYKVAVTGDRVKASFNGKSILSYKKPRDLWGSLALPPGDIKGTITVEGVASKWLERKRDQAFEDGWDDFEKRWKLAEHVPAWMTDALTGAPAAADPAALGKEPSELSQDMIRLWNDAVRALEQDDFEAVIAHTERLLKREPDVVRAALLQSQAWMGLRKKERAIEVLAPAVERFSGHLDAVSFLTRLQLISGRFEDVLATVQGAVEAGVAPTELQAVSVTANKGLHGPTWGSKHNYESRHYRVSSDLSREVCRSVAMELEETYRYVSRRLRVGEHDESRKFQVYAFSGRASYLDYIEDVFEGRGESTQGMYSSYLKQLLVLDSEPRDSFMHTVRHEGFHQYFDSILESPPIWLNEGLAEYFAASRTPRGSWKDGRIEERRLAVLRGASGGAKPALEPLKTFLELDQPSFMRDGQRNYAQAWAFVHFLRHSSVENEESFSRLMQALLDGASNAEALEQAFGDTDLSELDEALAQHVANL